MTCRYIQILDVLDISLLNCNQNTLGYCFSESGVAKKLGLLPKMASCLGPITYTYNRDSSVFYEFEL